MRTPTPATIIALIALFVALGGVSIAATGGNFILGQSNSATTKTSLSASSLNGKALEVTNTNTGSSATALSLNVASTRPPLVVSSGAKVGNLNADKLDGIDSSGFLRGSGHVYTIHVDTAPDDGETYPLMSIPGLGSLTRNCGAAGYPLIYFQSPSPVNLISETDGVAYQAQHTTSTSWSTTDYSGGRRMFIAEAFVTIPGGKMAEIRLAAAGYYNGLSCTFDVTATVY